jgi:hypothetical protein
VSVRRRNEGRRWAPDVRYIIKLRDDTVPVVWSSKTVLFVHLRREVTEDKHSGRVRAQKDRSHKQFKVLECLAFTVDVGTISVWARSGEKITCGLSSESSSIITRSV